MTRRKFDTNLCHFGIPSSGSRTDRYFKHTFTNFSQLEIYLKITLIYSYTKQSENRQAEIQILFILTDKMSVTDITQYGTAIGTQAVGLVRMHSCLYRIWFYPDSNRFARSDHWFV